MSLLNPGTGSVWLGAFVWEQRARGRGEWGVWCGFPFYEHRYSQHRVQWCRLKSQCLVTSTQQLMLQDTKCGRTLLASPQCTKGPLVSSQRRWRQQSEDSAPQRTHATFHQTPSDLSHCKDHKPGFTCLPFAFHSPTATELFLHELIFHINKE